MNAGFDDEQKEMNEFATGAHREVKRGKGRFDLISPYALTRLAYVLERGACRYGDRNWERGIPFSSFLDSALRHLAKFQMGQTDEDHLAHALWNIMALVHEEELIAMGLLPGDLNDLPLYAARSRTPVGTQQNQNQK